MVKIETTHGIIKAELFSEKAPLTVANFFNYVDNDFYNDTVFHRVIADFMIQGGGLTIELEEKQTKDSIKNEADNGCQNKRGTLAMARTQVVDSATAQFFINIKDNDFLNHSESDFGYAVFAQVVDGMDVVDKIAQVKTGDDGFHQDVPEEPVVILSVTRETKS